MAEAATVTLTAPNGQQVTVASGKKDEMVAAGYRLPKSDGAAKKTAAKSSKAQSDK